MIGTIERVKNNVLLKCSTLNDEIIARTLKDVIETRIYRFVEEMVSLVNMSLEEIALRSEVKRIISNLITKKIKRKLFIDSLALQITNDSFIEDYANDKITLDKIKKKYIKELKNNKNSNQLNMTEDLNLTEIFEGLEKYVNDEIIINVKENTVLAGSINALVTDFKKALESDLSKMIDDVDNEYMNILINELEEVIHKDEKEEGEEIMVEETQETNVIEANSKFEKYDDMTLFNKMILCLNTEEEKLSRKEAKLEEQKRKVEERLAATNKNIEANIERENALSQRKLELSNKEVELNSKLSEAEVIFLNMKPLIKGLSNITSLNNAGGSENE